MPARRQCLPAPAIWSIAWTSHRSGLELAGRHHRAPGLAIGHEIPCRDEQRSPRRAGEIRRRCCNLDAGPSGAAERRPMRSRHTFGAGVGVAERRQRCRKPVVLPQSARGNQGFDPRAMVRPARIRPCAPGLDTAVGRANGTAWIQAMVLLDVDARRAPNTALLEVFSCGRGGRCALHATGGRVHGGIRSHENHRR